MSIPKDIRSQVWEATFGRSYDGECKVCHCHLDVQEFDVGHIISKAKGGSDVLENLRPICRRCNGAMKTTNMYAYKARFYPRDRVKDLLPIVDTLDEEDLVELQAYIESRREKKPPPTLIDQERSNKAEKVSRENHERDTRAEQRLKEKDLVFEPLACGYIFTKGPRKDLTCGRVVFDGKPFCNECRIKRTAQKQIA
jgi:hypothetical protein